MNLLSHSITRYFIRQKIKRALVEVDVYPLYIVGNVQMSYQLFIVYEACAQLCIAVKDYNSIKIWGQFFDD